MSARMAVTGSIMFLACALGNPAKLSLLPAAAQAAGVKRVVCSSADYRYSYCGVDTRRGVQLTSRLSKARCQYGKSWGYDGGGIWVDNGCSAEFAVAGSDRKPSAGDVAAAIIVGGLVGAILDNNNSHRRHVDNYYPKPRQRQDKPMGRSDASIRQSGQSQFRYPRQLSGPARTGQACHPRRQSGSEPVTAQRQRR
ncbi:DUF3011 domain-containing protein [Mesorhizobium caraganae]|uniref:DUF3011 domain-containing protein n=1 Tax=Mesorhizobium caraganae TaxID=483206 RepID=A0ABV1YXR4_9HYPH